MNTLPLKRLASLVCLLLFAVPAFGQHANLAAVDASDMALAIHDQAMHDDASAANCAAGDGLTWIPDGATTKKEGKNSLVITAPRGYRYVGYATNGRLAIGGLSMKISCNCTSGSGCTPAAQGNKGGCVISENCSACSGTRSIRDDDRWADVIGGGFAQTQSGVGFASEADLMQGASVFPGLFEVPALKKDIEAFSKKWGSTDRGAVLVPVQVAGRIGWLSVSEATASRLDLPTVETLSASCSCDEGSCTVKTRFGVSFCTGDCSGTCSLDTGFKALTIETTTF